MTKDELIARLEGFEWTDFECKKAQKSVPKDAYATVSAFANTRGGWLLFGISEDEGRLRVSGVDPAAFDRVQNEFLTTLRSGQLLNQAIDADPRVYELEGKTVLGFHIPELGRRQKPAYLGGDPRDGYIRRAARDERMTDRELQRFLRDADEQPWDSLVPALFTRLKISTTVSRSLSAPVTSSECSSIYPASTSSAARSPERTAPSM